MVLPWLVVNEEFHLDVAAFLIPVYKYFALSRCTNSLLHRRNTQHPTTTILKHSCLFLEEHQRILLKWWKFKIKLDSFSSAFLSSLYICRVRQYGFGWAWLAGRCVTLNPKYTQFFLPQVSKHVCLSIPFIKEATQKGWALHVHQRKTKHFIAKLLPHGSTTLFEKYVASAMYPNTLSLYFNS